MKITILLADDHAVVRDGLRLILEIQSDLEVVGVAADGREAVQLAQETCPAIVIIDITMPDLNGLEAIKQLRLICPETRFVVLSMHSAKHYIMRAWEAGADGYLLKGAATKEIVRAIRTVYSGQRYLSERLAAEFVGLLDTQPRHTDASDPLSELSPREREVLQLVVEGRSSSEIAELLHLAPQTVKTYRSRLMHKLDLPDLPSLVRFAIQHGLTPLE